MNIMELGAVGGLVGGIAVIASLIYVGLQVKQSYTFPAADRPVIPARVQRGYAPRGLPCL